MARTKQSPAIAISKDAIDQASNTLRSLPKKYKEVDDLKDALGSMRAAIVKLLNKGYNHDTVVAVLKRQGLSLSPALLQEYLDNSRKRKPRSTKPSGEIEAAVQPPPAKPSSRKQVADEGTVAPVSKKTTRNTNARSETKASTQKTKSSKPQKETAA